MTISNYPPPSSPTTTTDTYRADPLPPTPECANCDELRRLLAGMRLRVDQVEFAYTELRRERDALLAKIDAATGGAPPAIEIVSDLPTSRHTD